MEISEPGQTHFPLDFSVNIAVKLSGIQNMENSSANSNLSSAFKVVTPKGKADGKSYHTFYYNIKFLENSVSDFK